MRALRIDVLTLHVCFAIWVPADANDVPFLTLGNSTISVLQKWPIGQPFQPIVFSDQDNDVLHYKLALPSPYINISDAGLPSPIVRWSHLVCVRMPCHPRGCCLGRVPGAHATEFPSLCVRP